MDLSGGLVFAIEHVFVSGMAERNGGKLRALLRCACLMVGYSLPTEIEMLEEYDFSQGVIGKYAKQYAEGTNIVVLEPDVAKVFPDSAAVNQALRQIIEQRSR